MQTPSCRSAKDGLLHSKRSSFARQKATFCKAKDGLLKRIDNQLIMGRETIMFVLSSVTSLSIGSNHKKHMYSLPVIMLFRSFKQG